MDETKAGTTNEAAPGADQRERILSALGQIVAPADLLSGEEVAQRPSAWGHRSRCKAQVLVRPRTTEEVARVLRCCSTLGQPVVTHGGQTGLVQGSVASSTEVVLSLERMAEIEEVDPVGSCMVVQAGATLHEIQEAAAAVGLKYPVDLGARGQCTIGGNISTNAGGNHVIKYGMTRWQVLGLEAVLADGTVVSDLTKMLKNNAGYDLKQLFIGSEGTLGVVTRAVLRLQPQPGSVHTALAALDDYPKLVDFLARCRSELGSHLAAFEVLWPGFYELVTTPPAQGQPLVEHGHGYYVILEAYGNSPARDREAFVELVAGCQDEGLVADSVLALEAAQQQRIWSLRDDVEQTGRLGPIFSFDVSLPIPLMQEYVDEVDERLREEFDEVKWVVFGHLGDGNLHPVVGAGSGGLETRRRVERCVYEPLRARGGSISAEHGVGIEKQPYLSWTRGPAEMATMRAIKAALDPKGILNPGRVLPPAEEPSAEAVLQAAERL